MSDAVRDQQVGTRASSDEFARYDQVDKPTYHLAEVADGDDAFDEDFTFTTCDMGQWLHGNATDRVAFAQELSGAMSEIGFTILEGHGIDPSLFDQSEAWVEELFTESTLEEKMPFRAARHGAVSEGYFPIKETSDIHPDLVEGWVFGRRAFDLDGGTAADLLTGGWPVHVTYSIPIAQSAIADANLMGKIMLGNRVPLMVNSYGTVTTSDNVAEAWAHDWNGEELPF